MIYTVTLNPSLDYVAFTDTTLFGKTNRTKNEYIVPGGKGINISILLSRLGNDTVALGFTGGFTGEELERLLKNEGTKCEFVKVNDNTRINIKLSGDEITEFNASGVRLDSDKIDDLITKIRKLQSNDWLCLSGSIPMGADTDIYKQLALAAPKGVKVVVDAIGEPLKESLAAKPFLIKPNLDELCEFFNMENINAKDIPTYAQKLRNLGAQNVLISIGEDGALLLDETGKIHTQKSAVGKPINTVAAGDSMIAGFIHRWCQTKDFGESLKFSVACGSATTFSKWIAEKDFVYKLYKTL